MSHDKSQNTAHPKCGAKKKNSPGFCSKPAGWRTDHPGHGKCYLHGGRTPIKHGRYSKIPHARLRDRLAELEETDANPLDLVPDVQLLRAMLLGVIGGQGAFDYSLATELVERISRIAKRIHEMQEQKSISLETFKEFKERMALVVVEHVKDADTLRCIESGWQRMQNELVVKS